MKGLSLIQPLCCGIEVPRLDAAAATELAAVFKALADPTRVAIVSCLASADEACVCDLTAEFELTQPTVSHHLRILRQAGLIEGERRGNRGFYRLAPGAIQRLRSVFSVDAVTA